MLKVLTSGYTIVLAIVCVIATAIWTIVNVTRDHQQREMTCIERGGMVVHRQNQRLCVKVDSVIKGVL